MAASESGERDAVTRRSSIDAKTTLTLGFCLSGVGVLIGAGLWAGTVNTKLDMLLKATDRLQDIDARVRVLEAQKKP